MVKVKRLVRYLVHLDVFGDNDWAGDEERKRSTTEVTEIFGCHLFDDESATRSLVALSSAEAEFHACNRGTAGGLQTCHFLTGFRGDSASVERQQRLPRHRLQDRVRQT